MSLLSLPTELVLQISDSLEAFELYSLLQCNHRLANILTSIFCNLVLSDPNTLGKRAFQLAAKSSDIEMVKSLVAIGLPTHILNGHHIGYICPSLTPTEINTLLSVDHFSVDARGTLSRTPLYIAAENNPASVRCLLAHGTDPNAVSDATQTPLMHAAKHGASAVIQLLLENKLTDVNLHDPEGCTALYLAVDCGFVDSVVALLKHPGINVKLSPPRKSACTLAWRRGPYSLFRILVERANMVS